MLKGKTMIVDVGDQKFQLSKMNARSACYLAFRLAGVLFPAVKGGKLGEDAVTGALATIERKEFDEMQNMLLATVMKLHDVGGTLMPEPVINAAGKFIDESLEYDAAAVIKLTVQALIFNIGAFFPDAASLLKEKTAD